jgi:flagellar basal-body rod protein FlgB
MFVDRILGAGPTPVLEQTLQFTEMREQYIADNIANVSTPDYQQKDLSLDKFQAMLRDRVDARDSSSPGSTRFDDVQAELEHPNNSILFHDGNNRSMEQLMTDEAKNALMHNLVVELLKRQYSTMDMALKEKL